jgi:predicted GIY-YIG superfamily endonuclease
MAKKFRPSVARYSVYVIALDRAVLKRKRFLRKNPDYREKKGCLYVGMTARTPEERFEQHKIGYKSCSYVRQYGQYLRRRLFEKYNPLTYDNAVKLERELAQRLRKQGYAVWQA